MTGLVSFGLAGGLDPALRPGAIVIPARLHDAGDSFDASPLLGPMHGEMLAGDRIIASAAEKRALFRATGAGALDRLELETTQITGNRELPKVMVIVPWKHSDIGDVAGRPSNSLVDEALRPVDRDVFRREVAYYEALSADRARKETSVTAPRRDGGAEK